MILPLRDENPTRRFPAVTVVIIALNVGIFIYQAVSPPGLNFYAARMGVVPYEITHFTSLAAGVRLQPGDRVILAKPKSF